MINLQEKQNFIVDYTLLLQRVNLLPVYELCRENQ